ncbi:hypothetical protein [Actinosynnema sp. NPDC020468]|uniref:hypothetical protein n=1 Tax=Actinosynnema sp. NPDC020468 TaxID=3154488 RepID=UPI0033D0A086
MITTTAVLTLPPTATSPAAAAVKKKNLLEVTDGSGAEARITVTWKTQQVLPLDALLPACRSLMTSQTGMDVVLNAVVAEVSAEFPAGGVAWPESKALTFAYGDGKTVQTTGRAYTCYDPQDVKSPAALTTFGLKPSAPALKVMWVLAGRKTADNPKGETGGDPDDFRLAPNLVDGAKCVEDGSPSSTCSATYGR